MSTQYNAAKHKEWYEKNRERERKRQALFYSENREHMLQKQREGRENNRERYRDVARKSNHSARERALDLLGAKCVKCGIIDKRVLQFDHKDGSGDMHRHELYLTGKKTAFHNWVNHNPEEAKKILQILCMNCNWIKRLENKEHLAFQNRPPPRFL